MLCPYIKQAPKPSNAYKYIIFFLNCMGFGIQINGRSLFATENRVIMVVAFSLPNHTQLMQLALFSQVSS